MVSRLVLELIDLKIAEYHGHILMAAVEEPAKADAGISPHRHTVGVAVAPGEPRHDRLVELGVQNKNFADCIDDYRWTLFCFCYPVMSGGLGDVSNERGVAYVCSRWTAKVTARRRSLAPEASRSSLL